MEDDGDLSLSSDWLVYEVLLRLPLNCVFTCRLVSKQWLSISSDPSFIRAYASRASSRTILSSVVNFEITGRSNWKYVMPPELYLRRPRVCDDEGRAVLDSGRRELLSYSIVGVSNGLVLYSSCAHELFSFYICNPITGRWIRACDMERIRFPKYSMPGWGFITRIDEEEFVLKRYRIIQAIGNGGKVLVFNVYYSEIDKCKMFTVPLLSRRHNVLQLQAYAAVLNGLLHWAEMDLGVIIYDPDSNPNRIRVVPHPRRRQVEIRPAHKMLSCLCLEYRGELRYIAGYSGESPGFDIWSLGDDRRWCFQHKILIKGIVVTGMGSVFLDPCDPDWVSCLINGRFIFSYNSKCGGAFEKRREMTFGRGGRPLRWISLSRTHPLVVPDPWPIRVDEEHLERGPRSHQANPRSGKRKAAESRILKSHPMSKSLADSGTTFEDGVRRSKRIRMRPLEYWKGERFLYGRVNDEVKLIGVKYISRGEDHSNLKVKPYVSSDNVIVRRGVIDPEKLVCDVHKKTGKQASVVVKEEEKKEEDDEKNNKEKKDDEGDKKLSEGDSTKREEEDEDDGGKKSDIKKSEYWPPKYYMEYYYAPQIFSDDGNPNACAVM